jgi:hypothetical protein
MRTLLAALTALMLFATPVLAGDLEDASLAIIAGDNLKALRLLTPLALQEHAGAQSLLGAMYKDGLGVPEDDARAVYWYHKAAEHGEVSA